MKSCRSVKELKMWAGLYFKMLDVQPVITFYLESTGLFSSAWSSSAWSWMQMGPWLAGLPEGLHCLPMWGFRSKHLGLSLNRNFRLGFHVVSLRSSPVRISLGWRQGDVSAGEGSGFYSLDPLCAYHQASPGLSLQIVFNCRRTAGG